MNLPTIDFIVKTGYMLVVPLLMLCSGYYFGKRKRLDNLIGTIAGITLAYIVRWITR